MSIRLDLRAHDVTLLPNPGPSQDPALAPERTFLLTFDTHGYALEFDHRKVGVPAAEMNRLLSMVLSHMPLEWRSADPDVRDTFRPMMRIIQRVNSTPSSHLFLAGFHIGDAIGLFDTTQVADSAIADSFRYLVGTLSWARGKKGELFFLPSDFVENVQTQQELLANGKLFRAALWHGENGSEHHIDDKLFVPYETPIGFNTRIQPDTAETWRRISRLTRRQGRDW
jgi:hypothetical protein